MSDLDLGYTEEEAWEIYCERGVIVPGFADEIAHRLQLQHRWNDHDQPLR